MALEEADRGSAPANAGHRVIGSSLEAVSCNDKIRQPGEVRGRCPRQLY